MRISQRVELLERQRALDNEQRAEKGRIYFERAVPLLATKLGIPADDVTLELMAENGDKLAQLIISVKERLIAESDVSDLA